MKKIIPFCVAALLLLGCAESQPSITDATTSDDTPATGQKILLQILSISDNYPMTYSWHADGGVLEAQAASTDNFAYWVAPETAGTFQVFCTVTDEKGNSDTHVFDIQVNPRSVETLYGDNQVLTLKKQNESYIGGAWASLLNGEIRYISSSSNQQSSWTGAFGAMYIAIDSLVYTLWGAPVQGNQISVQTSGSTATIVCESCGTDAVINDIAIDTLNSSLLWVGTDTGLYNYNISGESWLQHKSVKTNSLYHGEEFTYAATGSGIYALLSVVELRHEGDSCEVIEIIGDDKTTQAIESAATVTLWHVTDGKVFRNGTAIAQPPEVACSLDRDVNGNIWCGKYWWNGTSWQTPAGLEGIQVTKSVAASEGLTYFLTDSGALLRW